MRMFVEMFKVPVSLMMLCAHRHNFVLHEIPLGTILDIRDFKLEASTSFQTEKNGRKASRVIVGL